jgi:hypothetical protein
MDKVTTGSFPLKVYTTKKVPYKRDFMTDANGKSRGVPGSGQDGCRWQDCRQERKICRVHGGSMAFGNEFFMNP